MSTASITPEVTPQPAAAPQISTAEAFAMPMEQLEQLMNQPAAQPVPEPIAQPAATATPEKYTINSDANGVTITLAPEFGGEVYKGKDLSEAVAKLAGSKADANAYIKQLKTNPNAPDPTAQATAPEIHPNALQDGKAAADVLREMLSTLPPEMKQQMVAEAFNVSPEQLPAMVQSVGNAAAQWQAMNLEMEFHRACSDYVDTPENTQALYAEVLAGKPPGFIPTLNDLVNGWAMARYKGTGQPRQAPAPALRPPVMPSTGAGGTNAGGGDPWSMPLDQLAQIAGIKG